MSVILLNTLIGTQCKLFVTTLWKNRVKMKNLINKIKGQSESVAFVQELKKKKTKLLIKSKPPIRTDHHIFLEIAHPEDPKNPYYICSSERNQNRSLLMG